MNRLLIIMIIAIVLFMGCEKAELVDNAKLQELVDADQRDRSSDSEEPFAPKDDERRKLLFEMLAKNEVITPKDKLNAAIILQHTGMIFVDDNMKSKSVENLFLAHQLAKAAYEEGYEKARYFTAVTYDRYCWMAFGFQKYGTQSTYINDEDVWVTIDPETTDEESEVYNVPTLKKLLEHKPMQ